MHDVASWWSCLFDVFNERDADKRRAAIARVYSPDVKFIDPDEVVSGCDALDVKAGRLLAEAPEFVFSGGGQIMVNHDLGYLAWNFGPAGQPAVVRGMDIALVQDGVISTIYTLLNSD